MAVPSSVVDIMFFIEPLWVRIAAYISLFLYLAIAIIFMLMRRTRGCPHARCPQCAYDLTALSRHDCPECGFDFARRGIHPRGKPSRRVWLLVAGIWTSIACWPTAYLIAYSMENAGVYSVRDELELHLVRKSSTWRNENIGVYFTVSGAGLVPPWSPIAVPRNEVAVSVTGPNRGGYVDHVYLTVYSSDLTPTPATVTDLAKRKLAIDRLDRQALASIVNAHFPVPFTQDEIEAIAICLDEVRKPEMIGKHGYGRISFLGGNDLANMQRELHGHYVHAHILGFRHKVSGVWWAWIPALAVMIVVWLGGLWVITRLWRRWSRRPWTPQAVVLPS